MQLRILPCYYKRLFSMFLPAAQSGTISALVLKNLKGKYYSQINLIVSFFKEPNKHVIMD